MQILNVPLSRIDIDDDKNGRLSIDDDHVVALAHQISQHGLLHPITLQPNGLRYRLIAGNNRYLAARRLSWETIPAALHDVDDSTAAKLRLIENISRSSLTPIEEAAQLAALVEEHPDGVDGVAVELARPATWILDRLDLLAWAPEIQQAIHAKKLSLAAGKWLTKIEPSDRRRALLHEATANGINAKTARQWYDQTLTFPPSGDQDPKISDGNTSPTLQSTTLIACQLCATPTDIIATHSLRLCSGCMDAIGNASLQVTQPTPQPIDLRCDPNAPPPISPTPTP